MWLRGSKRYKRKQEEMTSLPVAKWVTFKHIMSSMVMGCQKLAQGREGEETHTGAITHEPRTGDQLL